MNFERTCVLADYNITFPSSFSFINFHILICKDFRMHLADVKWKPDVMVILGQNFRGLIAACEIGKVIFS